MKKILFLICLPVVMFNFLLWVFAWSLIKYVAWVNGYSERITSFKKAIALFWGC